MMIFVEHRLTRMPQGASPMTLACSPVLHTSAPDGATPPSREQLLAINVNPDTGLATDYLNHFNEIVMLLDLCGDMPELCGDVLAWTPATYREHFERSGFRDREMTIAAYDAAPATVRAAFDETVAAIDHALLSAQRDLAAADPETIAAIGPARAKHVQPLLARADALIHGAPCRDAVPASAA